MSLIGFDDLVDGWVYWAKFKDGRWGLVEVNRFDSGALILRFFNGDCLDDGAALEQIEGFDARNVRSPIGSCYPNPWSEKDPHAEAQERAEQDEW